MKLKTAVGDELRRWGWRRPGGPRRWAHRRARGIVARRHFTQVGTRLYVGRNVQFFIEPGGKLIAADNVSFSEHAQVFVDSPTAVLTIGSNSYLNRRSEITCKTRIDIGHDCAIAWDVLITDNDFHQLDSHPASSPVRIGDHVWVGAGAKIMKGVHVGDGAVVAAGAVVVRDVPAGCLVAGVPARVVRDGVTWA